MFHTQGQHPSQWKAEAGKWTGPGPETWFLPLFSFTLRFTYCETYSICPICGFGFMYSVTQSSQLFNYLPLPKIHNSGTLGLLCPPAPGNHYSVFMDLPAQELTREL